MFLFLDVGRYANPPLSRPPFVSRYPINSTMSDFPTEFFRLVNKYGKFLFAPLIQWRIA
jgi:hypothetical protein